jgi:predicted RNase H-like HicB family nuclease
MEIAERYPAGLGEYAVLHLEPPYPERLLTARMLRARQSKAVRVDEESSVYRITLEIQKLEEGPYLGTSPDLPGLIVQGASPEEVVELAPDIARELIEVMLETGEPLPPGLRLLPTQTRISIVVPA